MEKLLATFILATTFATSWGMDTQKTSARPGQSKVILESSDNKRFEVARTVACKSLSIKWILEDLDVFKSSELPVPLPNIDADILQIILHCMHTPQDIGNIVTSLSKNGQQKFLEGIKYLNIQEFYEIMPALHCLLQKEKQKTTQDISSLPSRILDGNYNCIESTEMRKNGATITMLSDEKTAPLQHMLLKSCDDKILTIHKDLISKSRTIKNMIQDLDLNSLDAPISFPNIDGDTLQTIIQCLEFPDEAEKKIAALFGTKLHVFISAIIYLDIRTLFEKLPAIQWLAKELPKYPLHFKILREQPYAINSVGVSYDDKFIVTGLRNESAHSWNRETGKLFRTYIPYYSDDPTIAKSRNHKFFVCGSSIYEWQANDLCKRKLNGHASPVTSVTISYDDKFVVTGHEDGTVCIFDTESCKLLSKLKGHNKEILSVAISYDNKFIVTGSQDNTAQIWSMEDGKLLHVLTGHTGWVISVATSHDNKFVVTGSWDGTTRIWYLPPDVELWSLLPAHLILIANIHEYATHDGKLDMSTDSEEHKELHKIFASLPENIQIALLQFTIPPQKTLAERFGQSLKVLRKKLF